jgi:perosamine synthetase
VLGRWQPPVLSPIAPASLARAIPAALSRSASAVAALEQLLTTRFGAEAVALTDSGTSALALAFRLAVPARGTVALPAYACVDLLAAAAWAGLRIRFYDVDPATLSPDSDSVRAALGRGADAIVVAHLYGFPADVPGVTALAAEHGAVVIEDAAQHAAGTLSARPLGALGPLVVLSFGRGKGTTGGNGGALLARNAAWRDRVGGWQAAPASAGWREWALTAAQWAIGRPSLYGIPASIPALRLGETIYKDAHEPARLSYAAASLAGQALAAADDERARRAARASALMEALDGADALGIVRPIAGGVSGYLRLPVLDHAGRTATQRLGIVRSYPRPLGEETAAARLVAEGEPPTPGARSVCDSLFTLPTHGRVSGSDREQLVRWAHKIRSH